MKKGTVVIDLDGTLCDLTHRQHYVETSPKNWDAFFDGCKDDALFPWCKALIDGMNSVGYFVAIVSGRPERCRTATEKWLKDNEVVWDELYFVREDGDHAPDDLLKEQWLKRYPDRNDIEFVVDDRKRVVEMWRRNGLVCLQCAIGDF